MYNKLRKFLTKLSQLTGQNLKARVVHIVYLGVLRITYGNWLGHETLEFVWKKVK